MSVVVRLRAEIEAQVQMRPRFATAVPDQIVLRPENTLSVGDVKYEIDQGFRGAMDELEAALSALVSEALRTFGENSQPSVPFMLTAGARNHMKRERERVAKLTEVGARDVSLYYTRMLSSSSRAFPGAKGLHVLLDEKYKTRAEIDQLNRLIDKIERSFGKVQAHAYQGYATIESYLLGEK